MGPRRLKTACRGGRSARRAGRTLQPVAIHGWTNASVPVVGQAELHEGQLVCLRGCGNVLGLVATVGKRIKASSRRSESNRELRSILDALPSAVICTDTEFRILECNRVAGQLFGYDPEELTRHELQVLLAESGRGSGSLLGDLSSPLDRFEVVWMPKGGQPFWPKSRAEHCFMGHLAAKFELRTGSGEQVSTTCPS